MIGMEAAPSPSVDCLLWRYYVVGFQWDINGFLGWRAFCGVPHMYAGKTLDLGLFAGGALSSSGVSLTMSRMTNHGGMV
jgi:hypothetical protein